VSEKGVLLKSEKILTLNLKSGMLSTIVSEKGILLKTEKILTLNLKSGMLSTIVSEKGILLKTEKILKTRHGDQSKFLEELERKKGVQGAVELQEKLEAVSEQTSNVNKVLSL
jgi:hypothetical protein